MSATSKKKNESPSSNYQEETPRGKVPEGNQAVKQPEDQNYEAEDVNFDDMTQRKETDEQPVNPIKNPPAED